jgi:hypothetical protein
MNNIHEQHRQTMSSAQSQELVDFCSEVPFDCIQFAIAGRHRTTKIVGHDGNARTNLGYDDSVLVTWQTRALLITRQVATSTATTYPRCRSRR